MHRNIILYPLALILTGILFTGCASTPTSPTAPSKHKLPYYPLVFFGEDPGVPFGKVFWDGYTLKTHWPEGIKWSLHTILIDDEVSRVKHWQYPRDKAHYGSMYRIDLPVGIHRMVVDLDGRSSADAYRSFTSLQALELTVEIKQGRRYDLGFAIPQTEGVVHWHDGSNLTKVKWQAWIKDRASGAIVSTSKLIRKPDVYSGVVKQPEPAPGDPTMIDDQAVAVSGSPTTHVMRFPDSFTSSYSLFMFLAGKPGPPSWAHAKRKQTQEYYAGHYRSNPGAWELKDMSNRPPSKDPNWFEAKIMAGVPDAARMRYRHPEEQKIAPDQRGRIIVTSITREDSSWPSISPLRSGCPIESHTFVTAVKSSLSDLGFLGSARTYHLDLIVQKVERDNLRDRTAVRMQVRYTLKSQPDDQVIFDRVIASEDIKTPGDIEGGQMRRLRTHEAVVQKNIKILVHQLLALKS